MLQIEIEQILALSKRDDHPFGDSLLHELKGLIQLKDHFDVESRQIAQIYSTRYRINQTIAHYNGIKGWLPLIPNLEQLSKSNSTLVRLIPILTEQNEYLHFVSPEMDKIYGVLQFTQIKLDRDKELTDSGTIRGTWSDCIFYDNWIKVKKSS